MTFNAASRLRSLEDRSAALGSSRCELPGMHSVPKSAVLPYASGVGGLSRRLLNLSSVQWCLYIQSLQVRRASVLTLDPDHWRRASLAEAATRVLLPPAVKMNNGTLC